MLLHITLCQSTDLGEHHMTLHVRLLHHLHALLHTSWPCQVTLCHVIQARRDEATRAQLSRKTANKMARADLIEAQRQALLQEMQHIRKDILQQESWLRVCRRP